MQRGGHSPIVWKDGEAASLSPYGGGTVPAGTILPYGGTSAPDGFLLCDGSTVSRTTYAKLYAVVSNNFGEGNGTTTFHLPDLRGQFLRGTDSSAGVDPDAGSRTALNTGGNTGDNVGSQQAHALDAHTHTITTDNSTTFIAGSGGHRATSVGTNNPDISGSTGGNETRPQNVGVNFIIKT